MTHGRGWFRCLTIALVVATPLPAKAQAWYAGVGLGSTLLLDEQPIGAKTTYQGTFGLVGVEWASLIGFRLEGTETNGYLWLSVDLTYHLGPSSWPLRPYAMAGAGFRMALYDTVDPIGTAGAGVQAKVTGPLSLFGEGRVHYVFSGAPVISYPSIPGTFQARTFLLLTLGLSLAP